MGGKPKATLTHPQAQPVPVTARRQVQQVPPGGPTWVEKGGPQKGGNSTYRKKTGNQTQTGTGRTELSRRHTKLEKRRPEVDAPRQPNHQPHWR